MNRLHDVVIISGPYSLKKSDARDKKPGRSDGMLLYNMKLSVKEIKARSVLSKSGIPGVDYCVNPYVGCSHSCRYCYASFMKRFTGHDEPWGSFVDVKVNAPQVLARQLDRAKKGHVMLSSVTDAYQPLEVKYRLTRLCLEALLEKGFPVSVLTKSPLVLRDIDLFKQFDDIEVGITISTDDEKIRKAFEPKAPPIEARMRALEKLHAEGIRTYVFVGPLLPMNPEKVAERIKPAAEYVYIDNMNYLKKTISLYSRLGKREWLEPDFAEKVKIRLEKVLEDKTHLLF